MPDIDYQHVKLKMDNLTDGGQRRAASVWGQPNCGP
jgi:hypothetical protein